MAFDTLEYIVRSLHILAGVFWVGGILYAGTVVSRSLMATPPQVRRQAMAKIGPTGFRVISYAGAATILFGVWNQYLIMGEVKFHGSTWNLLMGSTLVIAVIMLGVAGSLLMPAMRKMGQLKEGDAEGAAALQKRLVMASVINMVLGVVAVLLMVAAVVGRTRGGFA
ncbi:MAG TPA: hypothetical protein VNZ52_08960 [Candidatus Thermoplasmatota archaeon]|nr:hypothetical protein [Candidatus Thermoplasmatota archaeon]